MTNTDTATTSPPLQPLFRPTPTRPISQGLRGTPFNQLLDLIQVNFSFVTWLLLGATLQGTILLIHPRLISLLPALSLLGLRTLDSLLIATNLKRNPYMTSVINTKYTALTISPTTGTPSAGLDAGATKIAVLLLGAKSNHPFGFFAPGFSTLGGYLSKMLVQLNDTAATANFLGQTSFWRRDERGAIEFTNIIYFRDIESIHAFAHSPLHREAWAWWEATLKEHDFMGINHEIYEAEPGRWETIYANFQPTLLGATSWIVKGDGKVEGGTVPEQWVSPLVDAGRGRLSRSSGRLGWKATVHDERHPVVEGVYEAV